MNISGDGVNGIYWVEEPWPFTQSPNASAITVLQFSDSGIKETDVFFRANSFTPPNGSTNNAVQQMKATYWSGNRQGQNQSKDNQTFQSGFSTSNSSVDAQLLYVIAVHEFGHVLGRVHNQNSDSIMQPVIGLDFLSAPFQTYDRSMFSKFYSLNPASS